MQSNKESRFKIADQNEILESLQGLLRINSTSGDAGEVTEQAPLGENINDAINYVLDLGKSFGFKAKNLDGYSGWIEIGPEDAQEVVGILCHVDTVPVDDEWSYEPYDLTIVDGKMYGRGTNDDKGPAIASLYALKAIDDAGIPLDRRIRLIVGGDEENGKWSCMERYKKTEEIPVCSFSPDADYPVIFAEKGILHLKFKKDNDEDSDLVFESGTVPNIVPANASATADGKEYAETGLAAHAMEPEKGDNAMLKLGKTLKEAGVKHSFLDLLEIANKEDLGIDISDEPSGELTYNPAVGHVGEDGVYLISDIRYPVTIETDEFLPNIEKAIAPLGYTVEVIDIEEPLYAEKDSELVSKLLKVYNDYTGENLEPISSGGGTYARAFDNAVAFGILFPGEPNMCHKTDEFWPLEDLMKNTEIIAEAAASLATTEE